MAHVGWTTDSEESRVAPAGDPRARPSLDATVSKITAPPSLHILVPAFMTSELRPGDEKLAA